MQGSKTQTTEIEALFRDLNKPSLHALSYVLRHPDTWPKGFRWDYTDCDQCAMGLAHQLWKSEIKEPYVSCIAMAMAIPYAEARRFFMDADESRPEMVSVETRRPVWFGLRTIVETQDVWRPIPMSAVTPEMVADDIDAYLATEGNA